VERENRLGSPPGHAKRGRAQVFRLVALAPPYTMERLRREPGALPAMVTLQTIKAAVGRIRDSIFVSPFVRSETFSKLTGNTIFFKLENLQMTGSYKERGALNKILLLTEEERRRGVIAASAGNHAQAVAYHATKRGIAAQICMPLTTPIVKVSATRGYGAEVILSGTNYDETCQEALRRCEEQGLTFIHPFDDEAVISGQGTLGLEMLGQESDIDVLVVPVGGGGLIGGVSCAVKEISPKTRVIGVQTSKLPSMKAALEHGSPVTLPPKVTIADGIAVRCAGAITYPLVKRYVDDIVTVDEEEIANAILLLLEKEKTLTEGAGAVATAAVLQHKIPLSGKRVGVFIGGGNIDVSLLSRIIERGLVKDGRLVRLRIHLPDHPGALQKLAGVIAGQKANIVETNYDRAYYGVLLGDTVIDITMETRGPENIAELTAALDAAGYAHERVL
jgi:threonine dehydratase